MNLNTHDATVSAALLALLGATLWLLSPGLSGPFLFDDIPNFENLRDLHCRFDRTSLGSYLAGFTGTPGRPLSALSFLLNDCAWPSDADGFKLTNLLLHLLNGVLVFGFARALARLNASSTANALALLAAAIWLLHPIHVSPVFLTVQRMTLLSGTFLFAGLWAYVVLVARASTLPRALLASATLGAGTLLAFLSKENGALGPLYALVLHATVLRPALQRLPIASRRLLWAAPLAAILALVLVLASQWGSIADFSGRPFTQWERVLTQGRVLLDYVGLMVAPQLSASSLYNDGYLISHGWLQPATTLLSWLLIAASLTLAVVLRRRAPLFSFAVLWFLAGHAMESSVLSLELYFEHRNYVPLFAPAFVFAALVLRAGGKLRMPARVGILAWLLLAATIGHLQAQVWGNWALLSTVWRAENANSQRAQQQYGDYLYRTGDLAGARQVFGDALAQGIRPVDSRLQLIHLDCMAGAQIEPARLRQVRQGLADSKLHFGTSNLLAALRLSVQSEECPQALDRRGWLQLTTIALTNPSSGGQQRFLRMERAYLLIESGHLDAAIPELEAAWAQDHEPRIAFYTAVMLANAGRLQEAREWAIRPTQLRGSAFKNWLSQTDRQSERIVQEIDAEIARHSLDGSADKEGSKSAGPP